MQCKKCGKELSEEKIFVLKRGEYENKALCKMCFEKEKYKLFDKEE